MRIAVDVMGGDYAPDKILNGALDGLEHLDADDRLTLVGDEEIIREGMAERDLADCPQIEVIHASEVITMDDSPVDAVRSKTDSSIVKMAKLANRRSDMFADVVISAGNTGAVVAAAQMSMRRLKNVARPGIAVTIPGFHGPITLCDVGANVDPKGHHLYEYGHMASIYYKKVHGVENPRVALMSFGEEEGKGTGNTLQAAQLMKADPNLNYVGYAEGRDIFSGKAEILITEGFVGNVILKLSEGLSSGLFKTIAREVMEIDPELAIRFEPVVKSIYAKHDYHEYGGAPLLGVNGHCVICHGSSEARTIKNAIRNYKAYVALGVNEEIVEHLAKAKELEEASGVSA